MTVLVNCSLTASFSHNQFPSLLFKGKLSSDLVASDSVSEIMKSPVLGREANWTRWENEQDTLSHVTLRKKIIVRGWTKWVFSPLKTSHTDTGRKNKQLIHKKEVSDLCMHIRKMWKVTYDSAKLLCAGKCWALVNLTARRSNKELHECKGSAVIWAYRASPVSLLLQKVGRWENGENLSSVRAHRPTCWRQHGASRRLTEMLAESVWESLTRLVH